VTREEALYLLCEREDNPLNIINMIFNDIDDDNGSCKECSRWGICSIEETKSFEESNISGMSPQPRGVMFFNDDWYCADFKRKNNDSK